MQVKQDAVMAAMPDWTTLEKAGVLPVGMSSVLSKINPLSLDDFAEMLAAVCAHSSLHSTDLLELKIPSHTLLIKQTPCLHSAQIS